MDRFETELTRLQRGVDDFAGHQVDLSKQLRPYASI